MPNQVTIIGGGFSGLAAGVALSEQGYRVRLLERRHHLGGRAYSFIDSATGDVVDNGQHLFMACYANTLSFLEKIGCEGRLSLQPRLRVDFLDRKNGFIKFECPLLPAPFHLLAGLLGLPGITLRDKISALRVGRAIRSKAPLDPLMTVDNWLDELGQSSNMKVRFWYPMAIATLNGDPAVTSASTLRTVLRTAFGGKTTDANLGLANVGLSDLYTGSARAFIEARRGEVRTRAWVRRLVVNDDRVEAVELATGERVESDYYISAVPHQVFPLLLPPSFRAGEFARIASLGSSPIISINVWFDRPIVDREFMGLLGTKIQWLFNKDLIVKPNRGSNQVALVISAAREYLEAPRASLIALALDDLRTLLPSARSATVVHSRVIKERHATMDHTVQSEQYRPGARTSLRNLFLAGDWTDTGIPATIESAVLSGFRAAEMIDAAAKDKFQAVTLN